VIIGVLPERRNDLAQFIERLLDSGSNHASSLGALLGRSIRAKLKCSCVGRNQGKPMGEDVMHLTGDAITFCSTRLGDATFLLLFCPLRPQHQGREQVRPRLHHCSDRDQRRMRDHVQDQPPAVRQSTQWSKQALYGVSDHPEDGDTDRVLERAALCHHEYRQGGWRSRSRGDCGQCDDDHCHGQRSAQQYRSEHTRQATQEHVNDQTEPADLSLQILRNEGDQHEPADRDRGSEN
jgi:hypothetical protein